MLDSPNDLSIAASLKRVLKNFSDSMAALEAAFDGDPHLRSAMTAAVDLILEKRGRVIVTGVGKSGHIGRKIAATLSSTGTTAYFVHPTEASHGDLGMIDTTDVILAISWSGESTELAAVLHYASRFKVPIVALTSSAEGTLARHALITLCLPKLPEACALGLAPTTSTLLQLAAGDAIAVALLERRGFSAGDFRVFHPGGKLGAQLMTVAEIAHRGERLPLVPLGTTVGEAILTLSAKGFGVVGILDPAGGLAGVITDGDLRRHMAPDLLDKPVDRVMSSRPKVVAPTTLAGAALEFLQSNAITTAFVVEGDRPTGIIHLHDLLRAGVA